MGITQPRPRPRVQGIEHHLLLRVMAPIARVRFAKASGLPHDLPVGRAVAGPGKTRAVDEGLRQHHRVAVHRLPVLRQPLEIQRQHPRGEVGDTHFGQDEKTGVIGDEMQPLILQHGGPADPMVACRAFQRCGLPAEEREPRVPEQGHVAQGVAHERLQAQIMVGPHQRIPTHPLSGSDRADHDLTENRRGREARQAWGQSHAPRYTA